MPRTAEKAQPRMRLPRTITLAARNALTPLPNWPEPPAALRMSSMRLSSTMVPSSPATLRRITMPLLPAARTMLRAMVRPRASIEWMATSAASAIVVDRISPATPSSEMPWPFALVTSQSVIRTPRPFISAMRPSPPGSCVPAPSSTSAGERDAVGLRRDEQRRAAGRRPGGWRRGCRRSARRPAAPDRRRDRRRARARAGRAPPRPGRSRAAAPRSGRPGCRRARRDARRRGRASRSARRRRASDGVAVAARPARSVRRSIGMAGLSPSLRARSEAISSTTGRDCFGVLRTPAQ